MTRTNLTSAIALVSGTALLPAVAAAAPGDVSWELFRPTNTGIAGDLCYSLFIDDDDSPWIAGFTTFWEEGGMSHFDGIAWRVLGNVECDQITTPRFKEIVKTDDGIMWIATGDGLLRFDPAQEPWCVTRLHAGNTPMPASEINDIAIAPDGSLWLAIDGSPHGALAQYVPSTDTWQIWDTSNGIPWDAVWNWVDYVAVQPNADEGYTVWLGNGPMGLASFSDGQWTWYGGTNPPNLNPLPIDVYGERSVDDQGNVLMQTDQGFALRAPDGTYTMIPLPPGGVSSIDILESGRVVAATGSGFSVWDGSWTSLGPWGGSPSLSFGEETDGTIWVCGTGGAARFSDAAPDLLCVVDSEFLFRGEPSMARDVCEEHFRFERQERRMKVRDAADAAIVKSKQWIAWRDEQ